MAFPIVTINNKNPQSVPFPLHDVGSRLTQQCLGPPHAPPQTAPPTTTFAVVINRPEGDFRSNAALFPNYFRQTCYYYYYSAANSLAVTKKKVMRQQRPRDRRFLLPVTLILMTSLISADAFSVMATGSDHRWWPLSDDQGGPVDELQNDSQPMADLARRLTANSEYLYERRKKQHSTLTSNIN